MPIGGGDFQRPCSFLWEQSCVTPFLVGIHTNPPGSPPSAEPERCRQGILPQGDGAPHWNKGNLDFNGGLAGIELKLACRPPFIGISQHQEAVAARSEARAVPEALRRR